MLNQLVTTRSPIKLINKAEAGNQPASIPPTYDPYANIAEQLKQLEALKQYRLGALICQAKRLAY